MKDARGAPFVSRGCSCERLPELTETPHAGLTLFHQRRHHAVADSSFTVLDETFEIGSTGRVGSRHGFEFLTFSEHRPGHAGILGCDGLPVAAPLGQRHRPAAESVLR